MATKKYYKPSATSERAERIRSIKSPSNRSKVGYKKGFYSYDRYGFCFKDRADPEPKRVSIIAQLSALDGLRTGKVKRIKPGESRCSQTVC